MQRVVLKGRGDFEAWRQPARALLQARVAPRDVEWIEEGRADGDLFAALPPYPSAPSQLLSGRLSLPPGDSRAVTVPRAFVLLAESVVCHGDPARFGLLYSLLWRLQEERSLLAILSDADVAQAYALEKSVRRDSHKMKAFVRFKEMETADGPAPRRRFLAWFEPEHHIIARTAPFFQRRFTDMDWIIATPKGSSAWDGERLTLCEDPAENPMLDDVTDALWLTYFANIFNPARLKVKAMQAEMPKKYWKNLPEAALIPGLIAGAEASVAAMAARAASQPPLFHERLQMAAANAVTDVPIVATGTLDAARAEARGCTRCALHCRATQTVFGEGPDNAEVMFVGEQPGDQEDLAGRPFVGPAGKVFDGMLGEAGLDRSAAYVTNAVKHFKYEPRGKRRIHQKPDMGEVQHCKWWLKLELDLVRPKLVVALGATALAALTDPRQRFSDLRGTVLPLGVDQKLLVTVHPSYLLRLPDEARRKAETARFRDDLGTVARLLSAAAQTTTNPVGNRFIGV
ncbi:UdgX family uracil-DNA binding protein [Pararhizobium antarcticum]|uniref:Type-4 uracil-DNA glycosylase n=1 Tax=Pararhizobium antarcticum TaxID=1798805 RepID=A0A657LLQ7_9HYPH|nr:UdgX family uracil-DNA binding protein [Pararhizobium antarcticum]OJF91274.1 DNA polymerase [Pararhizobium antarcticum]OJG01181.1 DNA polymerase [Rhizobium sp. 58]